MAFKTERKVEKKTLHSDDGAETKVNIGFPFVDKAAGNDRARARVMRETDRRWKITSGYL